ncbi:GNAT family N-acetyltransferase [Cohnella phaseoli]|uniref:Acetyltransferase (GNAT) family protein n=1 Tax=Cohnella phaseoli TaxID=456490 RepID=A0A3D9KJV7_9BACL|nr:GNAT family N-acetyltransferase [Cohnella phaseoli]RED86570.1 acetyltransferase (GNAT) family protein [Cohnella phaseoli]
MADALKLIRGTGDEALRVRNKLIEFNSRHVPNGTYEELNLVLKNDNDEVVAGLNGVMRWNWLDIEILWVSDDARGQGLGRTLLEEAERFARVKECTFIKLNTFSFQAPEFYKKFGYEVIAIIDNAPTGYKHYFYKKDL